MKSAGHQQVLADQLFTDGPVVDQNQVGNVFDVNHAKTAGVAQQPDIEKKDLECAVIGFGAERNSISMAVLDLVCDTRQTEEVELGTQFAGAFFPVDMAEHELAADQSGH